MKHENQKLDLLSHCSSECFRPAVQRFARAGQSLAGSVLVWRRSEQSSAILCVSLMNRYASPGDNKGYAQYAFERAARRVAFSGLKVLSPPRSMLRARAVSDLRRTCAS